MGADGDLDLVGGASDLRAVGNDEANLDGVVVVFVFRDLHAAVVALALGKDLTDAVHETATDAGHAFDLHGRKADDARDHRVVDLDVTQLGLVVESGGRVELGRLHDGYCTGGRPNVARFGHEKLPRREPAGVVESASADARLS